MGKCGGAKGLHVVHVSSVHPIEDTRILHKEARSLVAHGYRVTLIARGESSDRRDGIRVIGVRAPRWRPARVFATPWVVLTLALKQSGSVYHLHDPELLVVGVLLKWLTRARIVFDVHENIPAQIRTKGWIPRLLRKPAAILYRAVERTLLPLYDAVVLAEDSYGPLYAWHPRVHVIHNYPLEVPQQVLPTESPRAIRVIYVGGISRARGAMTMLEAAALLREENLPLCWILIGGPDSRSLEAEMRDYVRGHDLDGVVELRGRRPFQEAQDEIARSDIGISVLAAIPNYIDSLPTKLLEYMMASLPVIASDFPLWRSLLERFGCGIVVPALDAAGLADAVQKLSASRELRKTMGQSGRQGLVDARMTWPNEAPRLCALYEEITGS